MLSNCTDCPLRLFNTKCHNLQGIGNPWCNRIIIVPNVDYDAYKHKDMNFSSQVDVIKSIISSTGELDGLYVLPLIRCNETIGCEVNDDIIKKCCNYLYKDFNTYKWKNVMLCGIAAERVLKVPISYYLNTIFINRFNGIKFVVNYNPLIKYIDNNRYNTFVERLEHWNSCTLNGFYDYNCIYL